MNRLSTVLDTLASYVEGLEDSGCAEVPLARPFEPPTSPKRTPVAPSPPKQPRAAPEAPTALLPPSTPPKQVAGVSSEPQLMWVSLERLADCADAIPVHQTRLLLVTTEEELESPHRELLADMLKAIGYGPPDAASPLREVSDLPERGGRILAMGNAALQKVSTAGMDLKIVRGMWQQSPGGKLISTFPPSYLHDNPPGKKAAWGDLQKILKDLRLDLPSWTRRRLKKT